MLLDSEIVTYMLGAPVIPRVEEKQYFKYINCLEREYLTEHLNITSVTFDISRYGKYQHTIEFSTAISEKAAIEAVEEYLSYPLTEGYYQNIVDDLFHEMPWEEAEKDFPTRGECLTDCRFLEQITVEDGHLTFFIGS